MTAKMRGFNRLGEDGSVPSRQARLLQKDGYWYFTTREGVDIGPFDSQADAEEGIGEFVDFIIDSDPSGAEALKHYRTA